MAYDPRADDKQYVLTNMLDNIEGGASNTMKFINEKMADNPDRWDDDVWRFMGQRIGGALIGGGVGSFGGPKGTVGGAIVGGVIGFDNSAKLLGNIPGMRQLGRFQDSTADGARYINEKLTPWLDPRVAGWGTRLLTDYLLERGVRSGIGKVKALDKSWQINQLQKGKGRFGQTLNPLKEPTTSQLQTKDVGILAQMGASHNYGRRLGGFDLSKNWPSYFNDIEGRNRLELAFAKRLLGNRPTGYDYLGNFRKIWNADSRDLGFIHALADEAGQGYVEHMIAKGSWMDWFWDDPAITRWYRQGDRHGIENVRLLFNRRYESLKNTVELITYGKPWRTNGASINFQRNKFRRIIVDVDDIMPKHGRIGYENVLNRNNPGDIIFREAGSGNIVGRVGDYMDMIYAPAEDLIPALVNNGIINPLTKSGRPKSASGLVKSMRKWRRQTLERRINTILYPNSRPKNSFYTIEGIDELLNQYPFLEDLRQPGYKVFTEDITPDPRWRTPTSEIKRQEIIEELEEILAVFKAKQFSIRNKPTERLAEAIRNTEYQLNLWKQ